MPLFFFGTIDVADSTVLSSAIGKPANSGTIQMAFEKSLDLTDAEKAWLADHKTIRVAFDGYFPPYSFINDAGEFKGLAVDVLQVLGQRIGITIEFSPYIVWKELYEAAQNHKVDVVATMGHQPEREKWFVFTRLYIFKALVIMTKDETTEINAPDDLAGKRVALVQSYQYVTPLLAKYPTISPYYVENMLDGLTAVSVGKADAAITFLGAGHFLQKKYQLANLQFTAVYDRENFTESIAVRKDWPELAAILDKALASLSDKEKTEIDQRWIGPESTLGMPCRKVVLLKLDAKTCLKASSNRQPYMVEII